MKHNLKSIICLFLAVLFWGGVNAQNDLSSAQKKPRYNEKVLVNNATTREGYTSIQEAYKGALREAQRKFSGKSVEVRNLTKGDVKFTRDNLAGNSYNYTIVELPDATISALSSALAQALSEVDGNGKFAINKMIVSARDVDKVKVKNEVINLLKVKGYKLVAKEYLEKLYAEQHQNSDIFNPSTRVKENNFSATGYYIDVYINDEYVQVQIINVSTGEYDGNAIVNF